MNIRWKLIVLGMEPARNRTHWAACFQVNCRSDLGAASCHVGNSCQQLRCRVLPLHLWLIDPVGLAAATSGYWVSAGSHSISTAALLSSSPTPPRRTFRRIWIPFSMAVSTCITNTVFFLHFLPRSVWNFIEIEWEKASEGANARLYG